MIRKISKLKTLKNIYHSNVNVDLMEEKCNSNQWWDNGKSQCEC